jgi:hypothetical protein
MGKCEFNHLGSKLPYAAVNTYIQFELEEINASLHNMDTVYS